MGVPLLHKITSPSLPVSHEDFFVSFSVSVVKPTRPLALSRPGGAAAEVGGVTQSQRAPRSSTVEETYSLYQNPMVPPETRTEKALPLWWT